MISLFAEVDPNAVNQIWDYYAKNLRSSLFTGFITISSFLLTMTTFVILNLKTGYFDKEWYSQRVKTRRATGCKKSYFSPLRNLGFALLASIALSLITAVSQFTLGLYPSTWSVCVCGSLAALTVLALLFCLFQIIMNLLALFQFWESEQKKKEAETEAV